MNKEKYLKDPTRCPFCDGDDLALVDDRFYGDGDFGDPKRIYTFMSCENCGKYWRDIYLLTDIEEISEPHD